MESPRLSLEARMVVILAGGVLERSIESWASQIACTELSKQVDPDHVRRATKEFLAKRLSQLPSLIEEAIEAHMEEVTEAA